jgi:SSS family solute:Na+ symporter
MLMFNVAHYALRPWPWIIVALASLIVFPSLESLRAAFPNVDPAVVNHDLAYAAMLTFLPHGLLGIMVASLVAAYISTIATCLNLGSAYMVNDLYHRFWRPSAADRELVLIGRIATVLLMICAAVVGLALDNAMQAFNVLLSIGAGTGLLFMVRWYWPRVSAWSEIAAMVISLFASLSIQLTSLAAAPEWAKLTGAVVVTTIGWIAVTLLTPPTSAEVMREFYMRVRPPGRAWRKLAVEMRWSPIESEVSPPGLAVTCIAAGCGFVYALLFAAGALLRDEPVLCAGVCVLALASAAVCWKTWQRLGVARGIEEPTSSSGAALQPEQQ